MNHFIRHVAISLIFVFLFRESPAQDISRQEAFAVAKNFASAQFFKGAPDSAAVAVMDDNIMLGWLFPLLPEGFVLVAADTLQHPVYAYSTESGFDPGDEFWSEWITSIKKDLSARSATTAFLNPQEKQIISEEWHSLITGEPCKKLFQQWPPAGSTSTGGWIETNWTQNAPYNQMCPMDLSAGSRSIAGCPAVAMAQILNFRKELNSTRFNDGDDYYHNYGSNQFTIDDDSAAYDFPGFGTLNLYLDSLEQFYFAKTEPPEDMKAALVFACGTAATQVYSASGSGTFGIDQAADAYQRFGYTTSRLVYPADTNLNYDLAENIKQSLPAHLGVVNAGNTAGHNVVVDGYNTDEFYHFNFGWGGSYNGWYTMPPTSMPYSLNYIEGIVLDIGADSAQAGQYEVISTPEILIFPNPATEIINIQFDKEYPQGAITLYDIYGRLVQKQEINNAKQTALNISRLTAGMYLLSIELADERMVISKFFKR